MRTSYRLSVLLSALTIAGSGPAADRPHGYVVTWGVNLLRQDAAHYYSTGLVSVAAQRTPPSDANWWEQGSN